MLINFKSIKVVAMDYDGTIVLSNNIKDEAFEKIFSEWPNHKKKIMKWHLKRDNVQREEKFRFFVEEILGKKDSQPLIQDLVLKFSSLTKKKIINTPFVGGAIKFLEYFKKKIPIYLLSATPENELNDILIESNTKKYFKKIYGAPIKKNEILNKIIIREKIKKNEIIFIGDSYNDQEAAESSGINFIGINSNRKNSINCELRINNYHDFFKHFRY